MTDQEINKVAAEQGTTKGEKAMLTDMMKAQNAEDAEAAEGGSFELSRVTRVAPQ